MAGLPTAYFARVLDTLIITQIGSKQEPQGELDLPRSRRRRCDNPCGGAIVTPQKNHRVWLPEVGVIEKVECLRSKLQGPSLVDGEFLEERGVEVKESRAGEGAA